MTTEVNKTVRGRELVTVADGRVHINFPQEAKYIHFSPESARHIAALLVAAAEEAEGKPVPKTVTLIGNPE